MLIGIPKEILAEEKRVAAIPDTVRKFVDLGFNVAVESKAGEGILISDEEYEMAGATVIADADRLYAESDLVLKVKQPVFNAQFETHEVEMLHDGCTLITFLHPATPDNHEIVKRLRDKNVTAFTMDGIPRISRAQRMDALSSMSTVTGYKSVLMAANHMAKFIPMIGTAIGTVKPAAFLVVGAGVVGLQAIATAKRLGGVVKAMDIRKNACTEAESLGAKVVEFDIPEELAVGAGGYAKALENEWIEIEQGILAPHVEAADVVILSALVPGEIAPVLVSGKMVSAMNPGSVIMDVSVDQGGNCEVTEPGRFIQRSGVNVCGIQNIPGRMAVHASWLYANNMYYYVENLFKNGDQIPDLNDEIVKASMVTHKGVILHEGALKAMRLN
ncbi:NAD(P) transhydrogenase subunit alpha [Desulfosarcina alkanivorans]|uniref:proton-translocating NAD(P)(+) transhydrogenase n=1 Tax=Desulfosarcina alkanivorans TaxID=571177 RepID=A0A5K7YS47_9BACT|nr:NAD(P) transhydrogenase subunit alpha [Desulfosarcina alkanivorans]BBO71195.1 NAD(P) transhydrogenase subunit alpha [Desulfosarcina alkanivorans]